MRVLGTLLVATLLLSGGDAAAQAERRIALVIGNAAYRAPGLQLENPVRDAELIAARLSTLGFEVDLVRNATKSAMDEAFQRFGARLQVGSTTFGLDDPASRTLDEASRALSRMVQTKLISVARD